MKLFDLFSSLSTKELRGLKRAIESPILNGNKRILPLFEALRKYHRNFNTTQVFREKIFQKAFPEKPFDDFAFRRICTEMTQIIEEFLLLQHFRQNDLKKNEQLLKIFHQRELQQLAKAKIKQLHKKIDQTKFPDAAMLQLMYQLETSFYRDPTLSHQKKQKHILASIDFLDQYYVLEKNLLLMDLKVVERTVIEKKAGTIQESVLPIAQRFIADGHINIEISNALLQLIGSDDVPFFFQVKKQFFENESSFSKTNRRTIFFVFINYAIHHLNIGTPNFEKEIFDLYKKGLEKEYLFDEQGNLTPGTFRNIIIIALKAKEKEWAKSFIEAYANLVTEQSILPLCHAYIAMEEKQYFQVIQLLATAHFPIILDNLAVRIMVSKAYFELFLQDESFEQLLLSYLDSSLVFIKRKKLIPTRAKPFINFIQSLKKLLIFSSAHNGSDEKLIKQIQGQKYLPSKIWLLEKIAFVKNRE